MIKTIIAPIDTRIIDEIRHCFIKTVWTSDHNGHAVWTDVRVKEADKD